MYYTGDRDYGRAGPPRPLLRVLAPFVVATTIVMFGSGIALLAIEPGSGSLLLFAHKASFVLWFGAMTVHVLAYVLPAARWALADLIRRGSAEVLSTRRARQATIVVCLVIGVALAIAGLVWAQPWLTSSDLRRER
jgi:hypothetical protein